MPLEETPPLLEMHGATFVRGDRRILDDLHLTIGQDEHVAIVGPNGSGKSSLIRLITRQFYPLLRPDRQPAMRLFGQERWEVTALRSLLGIVTPDQHDAFTGGAVSSTNITGAEAVVSGFFSGIGIAPHHPVTDEMWDRAHEALHWMEAGHLADKPMTEMSTGEARRVLIARALAPDPRALLLDEPTTGLDLASTYRFLEAIRGVIARGKTVLLVTHHVEEIVPEIERVILLREGRIFRDGPKSWVLTSAAFSDLFDVPVQVTPALRPGYFGAQVGG